VTNDTAAPNQTLPATPAILFDRVRPKEYLLGAGRYDHEE